MTDYMMEKYLKSIGKGFFVDYYDRLADLSLANRDVAAIIQREQRYTPGSCANRVSKGRSIIQAGRGEDALRVCLASRR